MDQVTFLRYQRGDRVLIVDNRTWPEANGLIGEIRARGFHYALLEVPDFRGYDGPLPIHRLHLAPIDTVPTSRSTWSTTA